MHNRPLYVRALCGTRRHVYRVFGSPTPIIESRVTNAANWDSDMPSVPAGLAGSTKYRRSAVLSWTRTVVLEGTSKPNSANTCLGSLTLLAR